jgi:NAD(P)-dependent dehydrogenase (short-subunit alcohol dehydrogenase family)
MVDAVIAEFGTVDILINNAGITKDNLPRMSEEDFDKVIDVNLKSVFNMTKSHSKNFLKETRGSIINMSSVVGVKGMQDKQIMQLPGVMVLQNRICSWFLVTFVAMQLLQDLLKRK